ncbi:MAG: hypothetical protein LBB88_08055 [Planctomycetaceae bacterium]|jgi:hypothetical protein|nr:hypothetical protein [Planctomycetaceae bacterium]
MALDLEKNNEDSDDFDFLKEFSLDNEASDDATNTLDTTGTFEIHIDNDTDNISVEDNIDGGNEGDNDNLGDINFDNINVGGDLDFGGGNVGGGNFGGNNFENVNLDDNFGGANIDNNISNVNIGAKAVEPSVETVENTDTEQPIVKPRLPDVPPDFFTLLLGLALVAIIIASILLFLEVSSYGPDPLSGLPRL